MTVEGWQEQTVRDLRDLVEGDENVLALVLFGSAAARNGAPDRWSDVDALLVVQDDALPQYFPDRAWLAPLGRIDEIEQAANEFRAISRICFDDLRRVDLLIATESAIDQIGAWPSNPLRNECRLVFSRSPIVDAVVNGSAATQLNAPTTAAADVEPIADRFWFRARITLHKCVRGDLLVALHLTLEALRDCCVLGMMLKDRDGASAGDDALGRLPPVHHPYTQRSLLDTLEQCALVFDALASDYAAAYSPRYAALVALIAQARAELV